MFRLGSEPSLRYELGLGLGLGHFLGVRVRVRAEGSARVRVRVRPGRHLYIGGGMGHAYSS